MDDLLAARSQMAMSLAFHIIFAAIVIAMPLLMIIAEWKWLRSKDELYLTLAQRWAKGTAILFAVGAVSGTVLSFERRLAREVSCEESTREARGFRRTLPHRTRSGISHWRHS